MAFTIAPAQSVPKIEYFGTGSNAPEASFEFGPIILCSAAVRLFAIYKLSKSACRRGIADLTLWLEEGVAIPLLPSTH